MSRPHEVYTHPPNDELARRASEVFFDTSAWLRPESWAVAGLIREGLTEADIYAAGARHGYEPPIFPRTLADLDTCLPYFQRSNDIVAATTPPDTTLIDASRDADVLHDDFVICHPDIDCHLLPASTNIWDSLSGSQAHLAVPFMAQYGITKERIAGQHKYVIRDSGFKGSVGVLLDEVIEERLGGKLIMPTGQLTVRLVCARDGWFGEQIMDLAEEEIPKLQRSADVLANPENRKGLHGNTYELAVALQTLPRYHGRYIGLRKLDDGQIIAETLQTDEIVHDIDAAAEEGGNASLVNPLGAAIVQYRVVQAALERSGQMDSAR
jgi:hypothetical protein